MDGRLHPGGTESCLDRQVHVEEDIQGEREKQKMDHDSNPRTELCHDRARDSQRRGSCSAE